MTYNRSRQKKVKLQGRRHRRLFPCVVVPVQIQLTLTVIHVLQGIRHVSHSKRIRKDGVRRTSILKKFYIASLCAAFESESEGLNTTRNWKKDVQMLILFGYVIEGLWSLHQLHPPTFKIFHVDNLFRRSSKPALQSSVSEMDSRSPNTYDPATKKRQRIMLSRTLSAVLGGPWIVRSLQERNTEGGHFFPILIMG